MEAVYPERVSIKVDGESVAEVLEFEFTRDYEGKPNGGAFTIKLTSPSVKRLYDAYQTETYVEIDADARDALPDGNDIPDDLLTMTESEAQIISARPMFSNDGMEVEFNWMVHRDVGNTYVG